MTDQSGAYTYVYDIRDRLRTNTTPAGALFYNYDANGNLTSLTSSTAGGTSLTYQYDVLNRLTNVLDSNEATNSMANATYFTNGSGAASRYFTVRITRAEQLLRT